MERILVPTDFSKESENAAKFAARIAKMTGADIYLLHVMEIPMHANNYIFEDYQDIPEGVFLMKAAKKRFQEFKQKPFFEGVNIVEAIQFERTYENIIEQAEKHEIDLIVMGSHGATGAKEMFVGSNTERVVRLSHCPVLTIKEPVEDKDISNIVFASDFRSEVYTSFNRIKQIAELFEAKLHLLKVITPNAFEVTSESEKEMEEFAKYFELKDYTVNTFNDEYIEAGVLNFSDKVDADIVSLSTHGRKGLSHLINGSLAEDVVNHASRPVLSIRIRKE